MIDGLYDAVKSADKLTLTDKTNGAVATLNITLTERQRNIILAGGLLAYTKNGGK